MSRLFVRNCYATTMVLQMDVGCRHFPSTCQGIDGVTTEDGEATCLTFEQFLAACQKIYPYWTLLYLWYTDDLLPLKFPFENAKGQPFSAVRDVFAKFTEDEWIALYQQDVITTVNISSICWSNDARFSGLFSTETENIFDHSSWKLFDERKSMFVQTAISWRLLWRRLSWR